MLEESGFLPGRKAAMSLHPDGRSIVIPVHQEKELGKGMLRAIVRPVGLTREELTTRLMNYEHSELFFVSCPPLRTGSFTPGHLRPVPGG